MDGGLILVVDQVTGAYASKIPHTIKLIDLQARSHLPAKRTLPQIITKTLALRRYLRDYQPDVLITTLDVVNAASWAQRLAGVSNKKLLWWFKLICLSSLAIAILPPFKKCDSQIVKYCYPWADQIVAASQGVADNVAAMMDISADQIRVIYNPVVRPDLATKAAEPIDHPWFVEGEVPVLLGAGRLVKPKKTLPR